MARSRKKKWKSRIKKALKLAAIGGAGYLASKAFGGRKGPVSTVGQPIGVGRVADMPAHLGETVHAKQPLIPDRIKSALRPSIPKRYDTVTIPKHHQQMQWGNTYKKGGSVTGVAKRGFGRALMKGKK